jgi:hypothetical protein
MKRPTGSSSIGRMNSRSIVMTAPKTITGSTARIRAESFDSAVSVST